MDIRELNWFATLADVENMTLAAAKLHVSQPTLSRALARLERRLGVRLFDRHQNRLRLNKYGGIFQAHALRAIGELDRGAERIAALVDPEHGTVSIGFPHDFGGWLLPDLVRRYHEIAPSVTFELWGSPTDAVLDAVRHGRVDIGIVTPDPVADDLDWVPLGHETLCLAVPEGHELASRESVSLQDLAEQHTIALKAGTGLRRIVDRLYRAAGITPRIAIETTELATLRALVESGMGVGIIPEPRRLNRVARRIVSIPLAEAAGPVEYGAVSRLGGPDGGGARRFYEFIRQERDMSFAHDKAESLEDVHAGV